MHFGIHVRKILWKKYLKVGGRLKIMDKSSTAITCSIHLYRTVFCVKSRADKGEKEAHREINKERTNKRKEICRKIKKNSDHHQTQLNIIYLINIIYKYSWMSRNQCVPLEKVS